MIVVSDDEFDEMISQAMDELPQKYIKNLDNVAITYADDPTPEQLTKQGVRVGQILLGLYEGIPQIHRGESYQMVLPDKITLFKNSILRVTNTLDEFYQQTKRTLWHEIAHHYGLDHDRIHALERGEDPDARKP